MTKPERDALITAQPLPENNPGPVVTSFAFFLFFKNELIKDYFMLSETIPKQLSRR